METPSQNACAENSLFSLSPNYSTSPNSHSESHSSTRRSEAATFLNLNVKIKLLESLYIIPDVPKVTLPGAFGCIEVTNGIQIIEK